jgi:hypothetical protein
MGVMVVFWTLIIFGIIVLVSYLRRWRRMRWRGVLSAGISTRRSIGGGWKCYGARAES